MWRASVVRMKSSLRDVHQPVMSRKFCETRSQKPAASMPAARADLLDLLAVLVGAGEEAARRARRAA